MKKSIPLSLLAGAFATGLYADWTIVSTFDDESALDLITDVTNIEGSNARSEIVDGKWAAYPGDLFEATSNLYAMLDLGTDLRAASLASGGPVTVYLELEHPSINGERAIVDAVWGLSNVGPDMILEARYNAPNVMQRVNADTLGFEGRNGDAYEVVDLLVLDETYSLWFVIDYNLNFYEVYVQGGQWAERTKLGSTTDDVWFFRVNPSAEETVNYFLVALSRGNSIDGDKGIDPFYFDTVAYDTAGENLSKPGSTGGDNKGPGVFGKYDVDAGGWLFADDFLGWANVTHYPWAYVLNSDGWVYVNDADGNGDPEGSVWVYHVR